MKSEELLASATRLGPVHLRVVDVSAALPVWRDAVGLALLGQDNATAELGVGGKPLIVLHAGEAPHCRRSRAISSMSLSMSRHARNWRVSPPGCGRPA